MQALTEEKLLNLIFDICVRSAEWTDETDTADEKIEFVLDFIKADMPALTPKQMEYAVEIVEDYFYGEEEEDDGGED